MVISLRVREAIALAGICLALGASDERATAQDTSAESAIEFPTTWVNSEPITAESLRGKGVFLWFFEENCPNCRARWPKLMEKAKQYEQEPILFIAVNSGSPRQDVDTYVREVNLTWPVIVDEDRSFERSAELGEISLQNVMQAMYLTPHGELRPGSWAEIDRTIAAALDGAKWNVDPVDMPDELMPVWRELEFRRFVEARPALTKAVASRKPEIKSAAQKLADFVQLQGERELASAEKSADEGNKARAYARYAAVAEAFAGYEAGNKATAARRDLAKDPALKKELAALKQFEKQRELVNSPKPAVREKARAAIQKLIDDQPDSEAARQGRELLHKGKK